MSRTLVSRAYFYSDVLATSAREGSSLTPESLREASDLLRELGDEVEWYLDNVDIDDMEDDYDN